MKIYNCLITIMFLLCFRAGDADAAIISFETDGSDVNVGDVFTVDLKISDLGADILTTFDLNVIFDDGVLDFLSFTFGDPLNGNQLDIQGFGGGLFASATPSSGIVNLTDSSFDPDAVLLSSQLDEFIIGTFSFNAQALGTSVFGIQNVLLGGAFNGGFIPSAVAFTTSAATVNVVATQVSEPVLTSSVLLGLLFLGLRKRLVKSRGQRYRS